MGKQELSVVIANPSGNKIIFVLTPVPESQYAVISDKLLNINCFNAEQVCFIKNIDFHHNIQGSMNMSGLEFCGNASRSFALFIAKQQGLTGLNNIKISVSGIREPLDVLVNTSLNRAEVSMPHPKKIKYLKDQKLSYLNSAGLVEFDGILHIILNDIPASEKIFNEIKTYVMKTRNPSVFGVMFYNTKLKHMVPVVYVRDIDTTYFEGSCASGTTALCISLSQKYTDGTYMYRVSQPAGELIASVEKNKNKIKRLTVDGKVALSEVQSVII
ncbi:hypothetical protein [Aminipila terrae]|uniref:Diaminopimelate epimerase n=1 Tax=Aminipila terrae TaxID=2697030 RepID=A0A6P1MMS1_9FIRM|nr:hypothetical protein [Aminipila terrae]QHI73388.1 hypothetical protein Ami3637_14300 [Aminipila terrae]